jgi:hypothetical protein
LGLGSWELGDSSSFRIVHLLSPDLIRLHHTVFTMTVASNDKEDSVGQKSDKISTIIFDVDDTLYDVGTVR